MSDTSKAATALFVAACALVSCSDCDLITPLPQEERIPIVLSSNLTGSYAPTRAYYADTLDFIDGGFGIIGYKKTRKGQYENVIGYKDLPYNVVTYNSTDKVWYSNPVRFWDRNAESYVFAAFAPVNGNASVSGSCEKGTLTFNGIPQWQDITAVLTAATPEARAAASASVTDYVVARDSASVETYLGTGRNGVRGVVPLDFYHILSRLTIKACCSVNIEGNTDMFVIDTLLLGSNGTITASAGGGTNRAYYNVPKNGINRTATFSYTSNIGRYTAVDRTRFTKFAYSASDGNTEEMLLYSNPMDKTGKSPETVPSPDADNPVIICSWLVAPFDINEMGGYLSSPAPELTLTVKYSTRHKYITTGTFKYSKYVSTVVPLNSLLDSGGNMTDLTGFREGKDYVITVNIDKTGVELVLSVATRPWVEEDGGSSQTVFNW